jgi:pimeloyl-ACP methyl ester carboxylesterase/DNA-binding SARP family transcriptional activator
VLLLDTPTVVVGGQVRRVHGRREQTLLVRLALAAPRTVPREVLVADLWGDEPPATAVDALRVHVSNLRKLLDGASFPPTEILRTESSGYRLDLAAGVVDVNRLETAVASGDTPTLRRLAASWPDNDLGRYDAGTGFFVAAGRHVSDLLLAAGEGVAAADLDASDYDAAVRLLEQVLHRGPYREMAWTLLIDALGRAGRRIEALRAAQRARQALAELGAEPGADLATAEAAALSEVGEPSTGSQPMISHYVDVDGCRVAYATVGAQPIDLLFMHGGFIPFEMLRDTPRLSHFLDQLSSRFRVILVDRRGIGMSDGPADGGPVRLEHWVADCAAVLDATSSHRAIIFGQEHAGPVAIRLAAEMPDRIVGLVLHSTAARPLGGADHPYGPSEDVVERLARLERMIDRLPGSEDILRVVAPSAGDDPQLRAWVDRAGRLGAGPARARELHRLYLHADVRADLARVRAPAVILHPARFLRTDPGQARYLADHLADAELHLLDSADHLFWVSDADTAAVLASLDRLLERVSPPPVRLSAIVAVTAPPTGTHAPTWQAVMATLRRQGATRCHLLDGAVIGIFDTAAAARKAATAIGQDHNASVLVDFADTNGLPTDPAVMATAARSRRQNHT